ncbi:Lsr2 family protein [Streptomyces sp. NPDC004787]|uniref:histone-like nucleoid-structuring protein Lsr2 n=1 Tax=Streptomyces sp. NPDC004787 TaxID=3154291 RepID=UPI0033ADC9F1
MRSDWGTDLAVDLLFSTVVLYLSGMAQKIITVFTDDLTGEESSEAASHSFSLDGVGYEIDLGPDSYDRLLDALAPFMKAGRKTGRLKVKGAVAAQRRGNKTQDTPQIREWAREHGYEVSERGRVPATVREAYEAAH